MFPCPSSKNPSVWRALIAFGYFHCVALPVFASVGELTYAEQLFPDLHSLMEAAVDGTNSLQINALNVQQRELEARVARGENLPQVRLHARLTGAYQTRDDIDDEWEGNLYGNLTVTQNLYHFGAYQKREEVAAQRLELEQHSFTEAAARHLMRLRNTYLQWILMQQRRSLLERSIELNQQFVTARRQLVEVGQSTEHDVLEMEARLLENREYMVFVEGRIAGLGRELRQLVGSGMDLSQLEVPSLEVIEPMSEREFLRLEEAVLGTQMNSLTREHFTRQEEIERNQYEIARRQTWPSVQAVAGVFSDQLESINQSESVLRMQYFVGVQVNWNIFDGWQSDARKLSTLSRQRSYQTYAMMADEQARHDAQNRLTGMDMNRRQIEVRGLRQNLVKRRVELLREQVARGLVPGADLIQAEIELSEIGQRLLEARVEYLNNVMELGLILRDDPVLELIANAR